MTDDEKALRDLIARVWRMAAACGSDDATLALIRDGKHATVEGMIAALSPPATDGGAKVDDYPDSRNAREHVAASERAAAQACATCKGDRRVMAANSIWQCTDCGGTGKAQACAFCDAPLDLCSCGGMAP